MKNFVVILIVCGLMMALNAACGSSGNGGVFSAPSKPVISPATGEQDPYVPGSSGICINIESDNSVRYTHSAAGNPVDPNCNDIGNVYSGDFRVGGPNETIRIKAIACNQTRASNISLGVYTFGECIGGAGCDAGQAYANFCD